MFHSGNAWGKPKNTYKSRVRNKDKACLLDYFMSNINSHQIPRDRLFNSTRKTQMDMEKEIKMKERIPKMRGRGRAIESGGSWNMGRHFR